MTLVTVTIVLKTKVKRMMQQLELACNSEIVLHKGQ